MRLRKTLFLVLISFVVGTIVISMLRSTSVSNGYEGWNTEGEGVLEVRGQTERHVQHRHKGKHLSQDSRLSGYVLTLDYTGQQSAGVRGILSQQCWIAAFGLPLRIVEPHCIQSRLVNRAELWGEATGGHSLQKEQKLRFSDFFDMEHFNDLFSNPPLVPWEEFVHRAPRNVIAVTISNIHHKDCLKYNKRICVGVDEERVEEKAFTTGCAASESGSNALGFLQEKLGFHVVRNVCINCRSGTPSDHHFSPEKVIEHIFGHFSPSKVSVVFNQWKFTISMTPQCEPSPKCPWISNDSSNLIISSRALKQHANAYINNMGYSRHSLSLALMVRLEWYTVMELHLKQDVSKCLDQVVPMLARLNAERPNLAIHKPLLALDVGKYGSSTWPVTLKKHNVTPEYYTNLLRDVKSLVCKLYRVSRWDFEKWEQSFTKVTEGIDDRGYIASLQSAIVSKADCLVLMGGGSFQMQALKTYMESHTNPRKQCVQYICMPDNWMRAFTSISDKS